VLEEYDVDIVFQAHWHFFERSYPLLYDDSLPLDAEIVSPSEGIYYITTALAGGPFNCQTVDPSLFETYFCTNNTDNKTAATYVTIIDGNSLRADTIDVDGVTVDTLYINH
jgi:hypothetical protein